MTSKEFDNLRKLSDNASNQRMKGLNKNISEKTIERRKRKSEKNRWKHSKTTYKSASSTVKNVIELFTLVESNNAVKKLRLTREGFGVKCYCSVGVKLLDDNLDDKESFYWRDYHLAAELFPKIKQKIRELKRSEPSRDNFEAINEILKELGDYTTEMTDNSIIITIND